MITSLEIEMLASVLARAGVNQIEAQWCNGLLDRLRALALEQQAQKALGEQGEEKDA